MTEQEQEDFKKKVATIRIVIRTLCITVGVLGLSFMLYACMSIGDKASEKQTFFNECQSEHRMTDEECKAYSKIYVALGKEEYNRLMPIIIKSLTKNE